jgi:hypothetical protein
MKDLYALYSGNPSYKRILLRKVTWWWLHPRNIKVTSPKMFVKGHFNFQFILFGVEKCNGRFTFRLANWTLELGW